MSGDVEPSDLQTVEESFSFAKSNAVGLYSKIYRLSNNDGTKNDFSLSHWSVKKFSCSRYNIITLNKINLFLQRPEMSISDVNNCEKMIQ